ncbi:protein MCM10 homolog isoform X1 [Oncorhynchus mykiss]|uniref:protein MCM10 homolog isoform X1 n=1 Tax=Oncorhynchus mykiss TaxID=8022 RepID=UPI001878E16E|nr:protein MCM10 homolog isoform X1 [Oncorhynchus mykiss]
MGEAQDYGTCKVAKKNGDPCSQIVNLYECQYRPKAQYKKMSAQQAELQSSFSGKVKGKGKSLKERLSDRLPLWRHVLTSLRCCTCKYTYFKPADRCVEEKHELQWLDATKCFFKGPCGQRAITLDRLPHKHCSNCVLFKWERDGMLKEKSGPKIAGEVTSSPSSSTACCSP